MNKKSTKEIEAIPCGTIIRLPNFEENLVLGPIDWDDDNYGRWVEGVNNTYETGIAFIASMEMLSNLILEENI